VNVEEIQRHASPCDALVQFTFACVTFAMRSEDSSIAEMAVKMLVDKSSPYFSPTFLRVLGAFAQLVINLFNGIYSTNTQDLAPKLTKFRTSVLSTLAKVEGERSTIMF